MLEHIKAQYDVTGPGFEWDGSRQISSDRGNPPSRRSFRRNAEALDANDLVLRGKNIQVVPESTSEFRDCLSIDAECLLQQTERGSDWFATFVLTSIDTGERRSPNSQRKYIKRIFT